MVVHATPQQAIIGFQVQNPANCKVGVYTDAARTHLVNDTDPGIDPNAQSCNRSLPGAIVNGSQVQFIVGRRTSKKSVTDGKLYSLSLQAATHYYVTITNAADGSSFTGEFDTPNVPLGSSYPELPPFDATGTNWANDAYPTVSDDYSKTYVDPTTGFLHRPMKPIRKALHLNSTFPAALDRTGGKWNSLAQCGSNGQSFCTSTGAGPNDVLFLPLPNFHPDQGTSFVGWYPLWNIDDLLIPVYCSSTGSPQTIRIWLTRDSGQTPASKSYDVVCPVGNPSGKGPVATLPQANPQGYFTNWQPASFTRADIVPGTGNVTAQGTAITLSSGDPFNINTAPNSAINIGGAYYRVATVRDSTHMTLTSTAPSGTYTGAAFGVRAANITGTNSVSVSFGFHHTEVLQNGFQTFNGDTQPCNGNGLTISTDAAGNAIPPTTGHLCTDLEGSLYLYVPKNADGSWRLEMRPLAYFGVWSGSNLIANGDHITGIGAYFGGWDQTDPFTMYTVGLDTVGQNIFKISYSPGLSSSCSRYVEYQYGNVNGYLSGSGPNPDCLTWTNLTPVNASPSKGIFQQMKAAFVTGTNQLGQKVGSAHPEMPDIGWMGTPFAAGFKVIGNAGCLATGQGEYIGINGCFNLSTGVLQSLVDSWSTYPNRWGGVHGWNIAVADVYGTASEPFLAPRSPSNLPFSNAMQTTVTQINKAGAGSAPHWVPNSSGGTILAPSETYTCPTVTDPKISAYFGNIGGTQNCIQVKINSPFCNHSPAPNGAGGGYDFAGGKSESQAFPCSTPGFGISRSSPDASGWSKLQDPQIGDWVMDPAGSTWGERDAIVKIDYHAANDIDLWLVRGAGRLALSQITPGGTGCMEMNPHVGGFSLITASSFSCGVSYMTWNVQDPTGTFYVDNPFKGAAHSVLGAGLIPGTYTDLADSGLGQYQGSFNKPFSLPTGSSSMIFSPFVLGPTNLPPFAGLSVHNQPQSYANLTNSKAPPSERVWMIDDRAMNPYSGSGAEYSQSCMGLSSPGQGLEMTGPVTGTTQVYTVRDSLSGMAPNPKVVPLAAYAGRYNMRDISGPSSAISDSTSFAMCYAYRNGECRPGSTAGTIYVSVPHAESTLNCILTNQNVRNTPAVFSAGTVTGQITQTDITKSDPAGKFWRKLGMMWRGPGRQYQFNHAWGMIDGQAVMYRGEWVDGIRSGLWLMGLPPFPAYDGIVRQDYIPLAFQVPGGAGPWNAPNARIRFGYAENGGAASFYCTSRQEECSTEGTPFVFTTADSRKLQACATGCTITVPTISGRVLYYKIDWMDNQGNVLASSPLQSWPITPGGPVSLTNAVAH